MDDLLPGLTFDAAESEVRIQASRCDEGITDIEVILPDEGFIVFEVKRGLTLPAIAPLRQYTLRCKASGSRGMQLVALTAVRREPAGSHSERLE